MLAAHIPADIVDSCSFRIPMICSSVNLLRFIVRLLLIDGLYFKMEEIQGTTSNSILKFPSPIAPFISGWI